MHRDTSPRPLQPSGSLGAPTGHRRAGRTGAVKLTQRRPVGPANLPVTILQFEPITFAGTARLGPPYLRMTRPQLAFRR